MRTLSSLLLAALFLSGTPVLSGCDSTEEEVECSADGPAFDTEDITPEGTELGDTIQVGDCVSVRYAGRLAGDAETFDEGTLSFFFSANAGLIPGFILGMSEQRVDQVRRVTIPPNLGYGVSEIDRDRDGDPEIPSCSTLEFDITLVAINQDTRVCTR